MRGCVEDVARVYKYYLWWPTAIENFRAKIDSMEFELNSLGKKFDIFSDNDGA